MVLFVLHIDNASMHMKHKLIVQENCSESHFRWGSDKLQLGATWAVGHTRSLERLVSVPAGRHIADGSIMPSLLLLWSSKARTQIVGLGIWFMTYPCPAVLV